MQEDLQSAGEIPSRIEPRKLLALGLVVGVSALGLAAVLGSGTSDAGIGRTDQPTLLTPPALEEPDAITPRGYLYGGNEYLPDPGRPHRDPDARDTVRLPEGPSSREFSVQVMPGDTLGQILDRNDISRQDAQDAIVALKPVFDPRRLTPGQSVTLDVVEADGNLTLARLQIEAEPGRRSFVERQDSGKFSAGEDHDPITTETMAYSGTIDSSLFAAGERAGLSPTVMAQMIQLFSYDVDFQRDIQKGDHFEVLVDRRVLPDGTKVGDGEIDFAALTLSGQRYVLYRFEDASGFADYYNDKGQSVRKALLKTPVDGARITSGFGMRNHPVLGYSKMHKGIDFAAPIGTPVYAAGDGVVEKAGPWSSYGNYMRIRHTSTYSTAFGHLSGYAKGIAPGVRVRQGQVVAYSGNTGRTTGPHLHYEVLMGNEQVNPLKIKMPSGRALAGGELRQFQNLRAQLDRSFASRGGRPAETAAATPADAPKAR